LDLFLKRVAQSLEIPEQEQQGEIQDWKSRLLKCSKYCTSVDALRKIASSELWNPLDLDNLVKLDIAKLLSPSDSHSGISPFLSYHILILLGDIRPSSRSTEISFQPIGMVVCRSTFSDFPRKELVARE
jgi:hypothetical protein